jgi:hypothetical protein
VIQRTADGSSCSGVCRGRNKPRVLFRVVNIERRGESSCFILSSSGVQSESEDMLSWPGFYNSDNVTKIKFKQFIALDKK